MSHSIERFDILQITTINDEETQVMSKERAFYIDENKNLVSTIDMKSKTGCHFKWRKLDELLLGIKDKSVLKIPEEFERSVEPIWTNKRIKQAMQEQLKKQEETELLISETEAQRLYKQRMEASENEDKIVKLVVPYKKQAEPYRKRINANHIKEFANQIGVTTKTAYSYIRRFLLSNQIVNTKGELKYLNEYRFQNADVYSEVSKPEQRYEIDATDADICLINRINRKIIVSRPSIYVSVDVRTGMITGVSITLE